MDTRAEYIKMADTPEIQELACILLPLTRGNWFVMADDHSCVLIRDGAMIVSPPAVRFIWLPTQDRLQEMVNFPLGSFNETIEHAYQFALFVFSEISVAGDKGHQTEICGVHSYIKQFDSMEQLWLAFVMKERFRKVWSTDKNEWVNLKYEEGEEM